MQMQQGKQLEAHHPLYYTRQKCFYLKSWPVENDYWIFIHCLIFFHTYQRSASSVVVSCPKKWKITKLTSTGCKNGILKIIAFILVLANLLFQTQYNHYDFYKYHSRFLWEGIEFWRFARWLRCAVLWLVAFTCHVSSLCKESRSQ